MSTISDQVVVSDRTQAAIIALKRGLARFET